jgi:hypothetical protein
VEDTTDDEKEDLEPVANFMGIDHFKDDAAFPETQNNSSRYPKLSHEYLMLFRRQVSHVEAIKTVCKLGHQLAQFDRPPEVKIKYVAVPYQGREMDGWEDVVTALFSKPDRSSNELNADLVIQRFESDDKIWNALKSSQDYRGTVHCEVCLASLLKYGLLAPDIVVSRLPIYMDHNLICWTLGHQFFSHWRIQAMLPGLRKATGYFVSGRGHANHWCPFKHVRLLASALATLWHP